MPNDNGPGRTPAAVLAGLLLIGGPAGAAVLIYGEDDRLDLHEVTDPAVSGLAASTAALFRASGVDLSGEPGTAVLSTTEFGRANNLCPDERFREQPKGASCSAALVGPDLLLTAGHCVRDEAACRATRFVFGFGIGTEGADPSRLPAGNVYSCGALVARRVSGGVDYALVRLDRAAAGRAPLRLNRTGDVARGTGLFVIGHPSGLPTKVAGGASVRAVRDGFFVANLDTYAGNSGSPVFNAETRRMEGILVRGDRDFVFDDAANCNRSNRVAEDGGRGEDVLMLSAVAELGPLLAPRRAEVRMSVLNGLMESRRENKGFF